MLLPHGWPLDQLLLESILLPGKGFRGRTINHELFGYGGSQLDKDRMSDGVFLIFGDLLL